jgi:hypothetical protein
VLRRKPATSNEIINAILRNIYASVEKYKSQ